MASNINENGGGKGNRWCRLYPFSANNTCVCVCAGLSYRTTHKMMCTANVILFPSAQLKFILPTLCRFACCRAARWQT